MFDKIDIQLYKFSEWGCVVQWIGHFLISIVLSGQYGGGKAIPVVIPAGGNVITNESETFSDTNLTVFSS